MDLEEVNFIVKIYIEDISIKEECKDLDYTFIMTLKNGYSVISKITLLIKNSKKESFSSIKVHSLTLEP